MDNGEADEKTGHKVSQLSYQTSEFFPEIRKCSYKLVEVMANNYIVALMEFSSLSYSRLEREEWRIRETRSS